MEMVHIVLGELRVIQTNHHTSTQQNQSTFTGTYILSVQYVKDNWIQ